MVYPAYITFVMVLILTIYQFFRQLNGATCMSKLCD